VSNKRVYLTFILQHWNLFLFIVKLMMNEACIRHQLVLFSLLLRFLLLILSPFIIFHDNIIRLLKHLLLSPLYLLLFGPFNYLD